ncbi:uncharacterized protein J4E79_009194 [Alternaria viburni]|uniref:uncharacterized protein n=1 Tax=Alternaria viburni TaxID=566460 RepID=UPI0020C2DCD2|nr:uncharacterized protein J4E79_009194 [Alternaria viburni]KAI4651713.1 hypothetical protein J4E79_009194 [Alternaria viburni]
MDARVAQEVAVIATRNQRESAFLRLPGEIRNQIYAYVFRDTTIPKFSQMFKADLERRLPVPADLRLLTVSRQVYAETRLLPFKLYAFQILPRGISTFINRLSNEQRDAITTFRVTRRAFEFPSGVVPVTDRHPVQNDALAALRTLETMRGLQRIVIYGCVSRDTENKNVWTQHLEKEMSAYIRRCAGNPEIRVVFEYTMW